MRAWFPLSRYLTTVCLSLVWGTKLSSELPPCCCQFVHGISNPCNKLLTLNSSHYLLESTLKIFQPCSHLTLCLGCLLRTEAAWAWARQLLFTEGPRNRSHPISTLSPCPLGTEEWTSEFGKTQYQRRQKVEVTISCRWWA